MGNLVGGLFRLCGQIYQKKRLPAVSQSNPWPLIGLYVAASMLSTLFAEYPDTARTNLILLVVGYSFVFMGMLCITRDSFRIYIPNLVIWSVGLSAALAFFGQRR
jgi:hypothetical protein